MIVILGILVGLALGLTGGGGSIFAVPALVYAAGLPVHSAIVLSLATVAITSLFGAAEGIARGVVDVRVGLLVAAAGVITAPLGMAAGQYVSQDWLLIGFAVLTLVVALRMGRAALQTPEEAGAVRGALDHNPDADQREPCRSQNGRLKLRSRCGAVLAFIGSGVGAISGFFGVGGGFLVVPCLERVSDLGMHRAVATSLLVIGCTGLSGVVSALAAGRLVDYDVLSLFLGGGLLGMFIGRRVAFLLAGATLQMLFAIALVVVAAALFITRVQGVLAPGM